MFRDVGGVEEVLILWIVDLAVLNASNLFRLGQRARHLHLPTLDQRVFIVLK